jgi:hypothetical protein
MHGAFALQTQAKDPSSLLINDDVSAAAGEKVSMLLRYLRAAARGVPVPPQYADRQIQRQTQAPRVGRAKRRPVCLAEGG